MVKCKRCGDDAIEHEGGQGKCTVMMEKVQFDHTTQAHVEDEDEQCGCTKYTPATNSSPKEATI